MARSIKQIYDALMAEKTNWTELNNLVPSVDNSQTLLSDITTSSKVADWRLWTWVIATGIWLLEVIFDKHKEEVNATIAASGFGQLPWWQSQLLNFQYGYSLVWLNNKYQYANVDEAAKIIKRVAVSVVNGELILKVAKLVGSTVTPLSTAELTAVQTFADQIAPAGTNFRVVSQSPDYLKISFDVYYDPLIGLSTVTSNVEDAINNYISNLPFDGDMRLSALVDEVQAVEGVVDPILKTAEAKYGGLPYSAINVKYNANAGHMIIDPAFPLATQINYIANV